MIQTSWRKPKRMWTTAGQMYFVYDSKTFFYQQKDNAKLGSLKRSDRV